MPAKRTYRRLRPRQPRWSLRPRIGLSLFWRTFFLLAVLLIGSIVAWLQTFRALEYEPRAILAAQQIASLVNLSRAALIYSDSIARVSLIKTLADQEAVRILPARAGRQISSCLTEAHLTSALPRSCPRAWGPARWWPAVSTASRACGSAS